jgi:hypothetical protein
MTYADDTREPGQASDADLAPRSVAATRAMRLALQLAFRRAIIRLATDLGIVLLIAVIAALAGNYLFIAVALIFSLLIGTPGVAAQAARLRGSLDAPGAVRQLGPVTVTEHRRNGISSYATFHWVQLMGGTRLALEEPVYRELAQAGERQPDAMPLWRKLLGGQSVYQLPRVVVTYSATGRQLLEVRMPAGEVLARAPGYVPD